MGITRTMEEAKFTNIEPGTYAVTCIGVKEDSLPNPQYGSGDVIKFSLQFDDLADDDGNLLTRETMASDYLTPGSKLTAILRAFGINLSVGQSVDFEACIGRPALAVVGEKRKSTNGVEKVYDTIEDVIPAPRAGKPATALPPSVINPDGSPNWAVFWAEAKRLGFRTKASVIAARGPAAAPLDSITDGVDAQEALDMLAAGHVEASDLPFE